MALINVNPTRMELQRLKKRLKLSERGHKLLKDKRDELMRQMLSIIDEVKELRIKIETDFQSILKSFIIAKTEADPFGTEISLAIPSKKIQVSINKKNLMSVIVPVYEKEVEGEIIPYGFLNSTGEMDMALIKFDKFIESLLNLAEKEKTVHLLADEIEETRRRVNALEYKLIPNLTDTIRYITMKLAENERSNITRLMKVKDIVRSH
jgi:V/A-type H+/Na+-transporting ATPase subunit D